MGAGRIAGKVTLVTGAARGIGAATARLLVDEGGKVAIADVLDEEAGVLAKELGEDTVAVHLDVSSEADWTAAVELVESRFGRLDALVNNAAILRFGGIDTPMVRAQGLEEFDLDRLFRKIPLARAGRAEEVARVIAFLVSDDSAFCTGAEFVVDGGATTFIGWGGPFPGGK